MVEGAGATILEGIGAFFSLLFFAGCVICICITPGILRATREQVPDQKHNRERSKPHLYVVRS